MIKLSIAIPTYKRPFFLKETLDSLVSELQEGVEIVISDNGSQDETASVVETFQKVGYPIRFVAFSENQGIDRNILQALETSRGEYVFFFSDDDLLLPGSLSKILEALDTLTPAVMCLNHFAFEHPFLEKKLPSFLPKKQKVFKKGELFFLFCGLGFLSSLIIHKPSAQKYIAEVSIGLESAHLQLAAKVALTHKGPFLFLGDVSVAGRALKKPRYHMMYSCVIALKSCYEKLYQEKLLSKRGYQIFLRRLVYKEIPRILYKELKQGEDIIKEYPRLLKTFPDHRIPLKMLYAVPSRVLSHVLDGAYSCVRLLRKLK